MDQTNTQEERVRNGCMVSFTMHAVDTGDWVAGHILGLFPAIVGENPKKQVLQRLWAYLGCCWWTQDQVTMKDQIQLVTHKLVKTITMYDTAHARLF